MPTPHEYYLSVIGKGIDYDGAYGIQCVDGFKHFCSSVLGLNLGAICSPTNLAHSIWDNFDSLGLGMYFDKVPSDSMVDGDWAIWAIGSKSCPSSHIAMFRKDNGNGTGIFLGQNQVNGPGYNQINISYNGIRGALRPKIYHNISEEKNEIVDQILHKGSKVMFDGIFKVDIIKCPYSLNLFGNLRMTGASLSDYVFDDVMDYHWIPLDDFTEVDESGNSVGQDQVVSAGKSFVVNNNIYEVKDVDIETDSAKLELNNRIIWVYCSCLKEV